MGNARMVYGAIGFFLFTSLGMLLFLDAGANEAGIAFYLAPINTALGVLLCIHAYKHRRPRAGALGLLLCAFWPLYILVLIHTGRGVLRQALLLTIDIPFILLGLGLSVLSHCEHRGASKGLADNPRMQADAATEGEGDGAEGE
jgi:4-amino-4-deoxy-L-arabinose transferase-like glycosyltransferase